MSENIINLHLTCVKQCRCIRELKAEKAELVEVLLNMLDFTEMYGHPMYSEFVEILQKYREENKLLEI